MSLPAPSAWPRGRPPLGPFWKMTTRSTEVCHPRVRIKDSLSYEMMANHFITSSLPAEAG